MPFSGVRSIQTLLLAIVLSVNAAIAQIAAKDTRTPDSIGAASMGGTPLDPAMVDKVLALDPERIGAGDVRDILAHAPAPQIILLQGSFAPVTMQPFGEFLVAMGYPAERIRNPADGSYSYDSFGSSATLAGIVAWYYERDGMMPMLIGHSQGGMLTLRTLHELAGEFGEAVVVWDPVAKTELSRSTIVDPYTGSERPVLGLKVSYATAIATGKVMRILLGQWAMVPLLRKVPDTVVDFTGFALEWDVIAGSFPWTEQPYLATGSASVRNVSLPASYAHIDLPRTQHLAANEATRAWIEAYVPGTSLATAPGRAIDTTNLLHAADIWYSVKKHWCLAAQRLLRERRNR